MEKDKMQYIIASLLVLSFASFPVVVIAEPVTTHQTVESGDTFEITDGATGVNYVGDGAVVDNAGTVKLGGEFNGNESSAAGGIVYNTGTTETNENTIFTGNSAKGQGGAISNVGGYVEIGDGSSFGIGSVITNEGGTVTVTLDENSGNSSYQGGAIFNATGGTVEVGDGVTFAGNRAEHYGGAISTTTEVPNVSKPSTTIGDNATFVGNTSGETGGAIHNQRSELEIGDGAKFYNNKTETGGGGAIYNDAGGSDLEQYQSDSTVKIGANAEFVENTSGKSGGAIYNYNANTAAENGNTASITIGENALFKDNSAVNGGAIANFAGEIIVGNGAEFTNNTAQSGGAIYNSAYNNTYKNNFTISGDTTFSNNTATSGNGGAIYTEGSMTLDTADGDITFRENTANGVANDIYLGNTANGTGLITLTGSNKVTIGSGIAGDEGTSISNEGTTFVLETGSINSGYVGSYIQNSGTTDVNSEFFGGTNNINDGALNLNDGAVIVENSGVNVANGAQTSMSGEVVINGVLNDNGTTTIAQNANVVVNGGGSYTASGTTTNNGSLSAVGAEANATITLGDSYTQTATGSLTIGDNGVLDLSSGTLEITDGSVTFTGNGGLAENDILTVTDDVLLDISLGNSATMSSQGLEIGAGYIAIDGDNSFDIDGTNIIVTGDVLTQNTIITNANISAATEGSDLTIGNGTKSTTLTLSDNATTDKGLVVSDNSTLKLSPTAGSSLTLEEYNKVSDAGTGSVIVDEIVETIINDDGTTSENHLGVGTIYIKSDNSGFTGSYTQETGTVIAQAGSQFFNGTNTVHGGSLTIMKDAMLGGINTIDGGVLNLQDGALLAADVAVTTNNDNGTYGTVNIYNPVAGVAGEGEFEGKTVIDDSLIEEGKLEYINQDGSANKNITVDGGGLGLFNNTIIDAMDDGLTLGNTDAGNAPDGVYHLTLGNGSGVEASNIELKDNTSLTYKDNSYIKQDSTVNMEGNASLNFANDKTDINYNPSIISSSVDASINKSGAGSTTIESSLTQFNGSVNVTGGSLDFAGDDQNEVLNLSGISVENGSLNTDAHILVNESSGDYGKVTVNNGTLTVNNSLEADTSISVTDGTLNILGSLGAGDDTSVDAEIKFESSNISVGEDLVGDKVSSDNSNVVVGKDVIFTDELTVSNGSNLTVNGDVTGTGDTSKLNISDSDTTVTLNGDNANVGNINLTDGTLNNFTNMIVNHDMIIASSGADYTPTINMQDGRVNTITVNENLTQSSNVNMAFDYDPRGDAMDQIVVGSNVSVENSSEIIIAGINFINSPDNYTFTIDGSKLIVGQDGHGYANIGDSRFIANTALGQYLVTSTSGGGGAINGSLQYINPQMYRGQVVTVAQYANQLAFNNLLFDHAAIVSGQFGSGSDDEIANRYAAANPLFGPYQYSKKDGGLWFKAYGNIENISMTKGLHVDNTAYGAIVGADLPVVELKQGWKLIPTAYVAYNGAHQNYDFVSMYQNGGQIGAMATAYKGDFFTSLLAYGGGYANEMNVRNMGYGATTLADNTGNWFAGVASKSAYNFRLPKDFIIQPTAMIAYNIFGNQNYGSTFGGNLGMSTGFLNGINLAPGVNVIWNKKTFSIYGTAQMMFNIMGGVDGQAGRVTLDDVRMKHPYIEYGLGAVKSFKDRLSGYFQFTIRNGGRTGIGFMGGIQYKLGK